MMEHSYYFISYKLLRTKLETQKHQLSKQQTKNQQHLFCKETLLKVGTFYITVGKMKHVRLKW